MGMNPEQNTGKMLQPESSRNHRKAFQSQHVCLTLPFSPRWQLRSTLHGDPVQPRHPRSGRRRQRPQLRPHQQLPPGVTARHSHPLPGGTFRTQHASGVPRGARRALRQSQQEQTSTRFAEPASDTCRQVRHTMERLYRCRPRLAWVREDFCMKHKADHPFCFTDVLRHSDAVRDSCRSLKYLNAWLK